MFVILNIIQNKRLFYISKSISNFKKSKFKQTADNWIGEQNTTLASLLNIQGKIYVVSQNTV